MSCERDIARWAEMTTVELRQLDPSACRGTVDTSDNVTPAHKQRRSGAGLAGAIGNTGDRCDF
ncbi:MAG TPA: hypothetical protein DCE47_05570 [Planctomycetaceae bacterium]|nr:hypothetical protein [Planctomycetaceae bacterium]HCC99371.1 hypothetical protein [Planctomycetaceae bacterium]